MTTEQKEAIEYLEQFIGKKKEYKCKPIKVKTLNNTREALETVLNLIQEQEKEIKSLDKAIHDEILENYDKQELYKKQLQKKDNIIDELAKAFKQDDVRSVEEIKQFYERKVENDNSKE